MKTWTSTELFDALKHVKLGGNTCLYTVEKCEELVPIVNRILKLKEEKNAIILAHSYVVPDIIHTVSDFVGDSYELSKRAKESNADTIIFAAVKFMAESAKLLSPDKTVIVPSELNGCSLADSITGDDVKKLKKEYPNYTFVCYINTTADVKAECDVCVTSSNVYKIIEAIPNENVYFLPDRLMAKNVINDFEKRGIKKNIKFWDGTCYVHEEYSPEMIEYIRIQYPDVKILAHPECDESIINLSDYVGSTSQMVNEVKASNNSHYFLLTECGLTSRLQMEDPSKTFVGTCTMCKYMKANSLADIEKSLRDPNPELIINIPEDIQTKALSCIDAMFSYNS
jgi:quinolinate synthase